MNSFSPQIPGEFFRADTSKLLLVAVVCAVLVGALSSCSPAYVLRAGWEEAQILLKRKKIRTLLESPETEPALAEKLKLVLDTRSFAESVGMQPKGSFTKYSEIDRDVLIWVLSGSAKTSLSPVTWWFPIVGRVPYKGFFDKEQAIKEARKLKDKGFDIYLRPSPAFSTLGWFDDPLLSTVVSFDEVSLVNTVIHELLHNTIWFKGHVPFNETLANVVGSLGSQEYFTKRKGEESKEALLAKDIWHDELLYAHFLVETTKTLREFYASIDREAVDKDSSGALLEQALMQREKLFSEARLRWQQNASRLKTDRFLQTPQQLNNATILAQEVYLDRPWLFVELFEASGNSLENFIDELSIVRKDIAARKIDPYTAVKQRSTELLSQPKGSDG